MTTHMHPDKLPIIATPIVDSQKVAIKDFGDMVYFVVAEELEERARTAEAQLAVAVALLDIYAADTGGTTRAKLALAEIAAIGGGE